MQKNRETRGGIGPRVALLGVGALVIVFCDQMTKLAASHVLELGQSVAVIPGFLRFTLVHNTGMAFGLLSGSDIPFKTFLMTLARVAALSLVTLYALRSPHGERLTRLGPALILGGAFGNIIDGIRLGYVVDFIDVFVRDAHWPAFNIADSCICVGVGLLLLDSLRHRPPELGTEPQVATESGRGES